MEFNLFDKIGQNREPNTLISDNDVEKRNQITTKLFDKRKLILSAENISAEDLAMNDLDLSTFGLTKVDYEVYLAKQNKELH